jgi:hypothetical protein
MSGAAINIIVAAWFDRRRGLAVNWALNGACAGGIIIAPLLQITAWLDENWLADGWAVTPSGTRGALDDAISIYFADATLASAFVPRWCVGSKVETAGRVFQVRRRAGAADRREAAFNALRLVSPRQFPSPGYSWGSSSSRQPIKAVGKL